MAKVSLHEKNVLIQRKVMLNHAQTCLDEINRLSAAARRCIDGGGFPYYLEDLARNARNLEILAGAFHALSSAHFDALNEKRRQTKTPKKR